MAAFNVGAGLLSGVLVVTGSHLVQPFDIGSGAGPSLGPANW